MEDQKAIVYTVVIHGKPAGPYSLEQLKTLAILPGTFVRTPGMDDYKEAHEFTELRALFGFNHEQTAPQYFASFDQRLLASVIDYFIILLVYICLLLIAFLFVTDRTQRITTGVLFLPAIPILKYLYGSIAECSVHQGTAGKRLLNIKVTDLMGNQLSFSTSLLRNTAKILSVLPVFFGYLYIFLNKKQQSWHDIAANTLVIKDRLI